MQKKTITEEQALSRLAAMCAKAEYCTADIDGKMRRWGLGDDARQRNIDWLVENHYVDDARYCRAFINDKIDYNHWGRRKIEQALWMKHIPEDVSRPLLDEVPEERYCDILRPLLKAKWPSIKADTDYERSMKLMRFAVGRGFSIEDIKRCMPELSEEF